MKKKEQTIHPTSTTNNNCKNHINGFSQQNHFTNNCKIVKTVSKNEWFPSAAGAQQEHLLFVCLPQPTYSRLCVP